MKTERTTWLTSFDDEIAQEDLNSFIWRMRSKDELKLSATELGSTLKDNVLSVYRESRKTKFAEDYENTISIGANALEAIPSVEFEYDEEKKTAYWWQIAIIVSNTYYHYIYDYPDIELYGRAEKFQSWVIKFAVFEPVLHSWSLSRLAAFLTCRHEFGEDGDDTYIEEARARSLFAVRIWRMPGFDWSIRIRETALSSVECCIIETHSLVMLSHFHTTNHSISLDQALEHSYYVVNRIATYSKGIESRASRLCSHGTMLIAKY